MSRITSQSSKSRDNRDIQDVQSPNNAIPAVIKKKMKSILSAKQLQQKKEAEAERAKK